MKKIINGKKYDTETAKRLATSGSPDSFSTDFSWYNEELFVKKTGEFFLYGEGGPMSKYAKSIDENRWIGSESIIPITKEEALKWAEDNLSCEKYEEIFGMVEE